MREVALEGFADVALVDSLATEFQNTGNRYSDLHDAGVGIMARQHLGELEWTLRLEFPIEMNAGNLAADVRPPPGSHIAFRWLVGLSPTF